MERYGRGMIDGAASRSDAPSVETVMHQELARSDAMAETVIPILRHLLGNDSNSLFSDDILARVRSMCDDIAQQLLDELAIAENREEDAARIASALRENTAFLAHLHALALEWQLTERMEARYSLDPVLSPLMQALVASRDDATQALAMKTLAAQARYCQAQRRMSLTLGELPGDHLHFALLCLQGVLGDRPETGLAEAEPAIRARFDESRSRLGLMTRLITGLGSGGIAALSLTHGGVALFLTALAIGSGQDRDAAALATHDGQVARLALSLRAAGLKPAAVAEQFVSLHPDLTLPEGFDRLGADRAAAILASGGTYPAG